MVPLFVNETIHFPLGENATQVTKNICPSIGAIMSWPVSTFQTRIILSKEPEKTPLPSGENATELTEKV
jgi:hypothetical protein